MMRLMGGATLVAVGVMLAPVAAPAQTPELVNARVEISAAVASSSATLEAIERQANSRDRARQAEIATLQTRLTEAEARGAAEVASLQAELVEAREALVADLGARDPAYAEVIAAFRAEVTDVASTAEGAAALAQFNRGEEVEALDVLDRLNAAEDEARRRAIEGATRALQLQADQAAAARHRSTAALALEARNRSRLETDEVIARYEEVTRLDPNVDNDWLQLAELYFSVGRRAEAVSAAERVQTLTTSYWARSSARALIADILLAQGDSQDALAVYESILANHVRIFSADSSSLGVGTRVYRVLDKIGEAYLTRQDYASALERFELALLLAERLSESDPQSAELERYVSVSVTKIGDVLERQGDLDGALSRYRRGLEIFERLSAADPASLDDASNVAASLSRIGGLLIRQGDLDGALVLYRRSLEIAERLSAADPASVDLARSVYTSSLRLGDLTGERRYWQQALAVLLDLEARGALAEADRPFIAQIEARLEGSTIPAP